MQWVAAKHTASAERAMELVIIAQIKKTRQKQDIGPVELQSSLVETSQVGGSEISYNI